MVDKGLLIGVYQEAEKVGGTRVHVIFRTYLFPVELFTFASQDLPITSFIAFKKSIIIS